MPTPQQPPSWLPGALWLTGGVLTALGVGVQFGVGYGLASLGLWAMASAWVGGR